MPTAHLPGDLLMHYDDDDFTDPWSPAETVILHHGNAKSAKLWYGWVPLLARDCIHHPQAGPAGPIGDAGDPPAVPRPRARTED